MKRIDESDMGNRNLKGLIFYNAGEFAFDNAFDEIVRLAKEIHSQYERSFCSILIRR